MMTDLTHTGQQICLLARGTGKTVAEGSIISMVAILRERSVLRRVRL